jgi:Fe2+ transport system protein FeoA
MNRKVPDRLRCPLCGLEFASSQAQCHVGCPMGRYCNLVACPNCQYEFPPETEAFAWLKRWLRGKQSAHARRDTMSLPELMEGACCELVSLNSAQGTRRNALAVFGLVPGARLVLRQKRPTFVIHVGETELALEADIAREILVKPLGPLGAAVRTSETLSHRDH